MEELSTQLKNIMIAIEVLFLLGLIVPILTLGVASQEDNSSQLCKFKKEVTEPQICVLFTDETVRMQCNHEPGEQVNICQFMSMSGGSQECSLVVTDSTLNETFRENFRFKVGHNYVDLTIPKSGPHINGSVFNCVVSTINSTNFLSVTSLQIAVEPPPYLMDHINCTSKNECTMLIVTSPGVVTKSVSLPCHLGSTSFNVTHAITRVHCQSHMDKSCIEFNATFQLTNSTSENARQLSLGPVCRDDNVQDLGETSTEPTVETTNDAPKKGGPVYRNDDVQDLGKTSTEQTVETTSDAPEKGGVSVIVIIVVPVAVVGIIILVVIVWIYRKKMPGCKEIQSRSNLDDQAGSYKYVNEDANVRTENREESSELSNHSPDLNH